MKWQARANDLRVDEEGKPFGESRLRTSTRRRSRTATSWLDESSIGIASLLASTERPDVENPHNPLLRVDLEQNTKGAGEQDALFPLPRFTFTKRVGLQLLI